MNNSNSIIIHQTPADELLAMFGIVVADQLKNLLPQQPLQPVKSILTRRETAEMLGISLVTLHEWTKNGTIQGTRVGTRVRYRYSDIEAALKDIRNIKYQRK